MNLHLQILINKTKLKNIKVFIISNESKFHENRSSGSTVILCSRPTLRSVSEIFHTANTTLYLKTHVTELWESTLCRLWTAYRGELLRVAPFKNLFLWYWIKVERDMAGLLTQYFLLWKGEEDYMNKTILSDCGEKLNTSSRLFTKQYKHLCHWNDENMLIYY